jgi:hypothetical protein
MSQTASNVGRAESSERVSSRTYFQIRTPLFWISALFVAAIGASVGMLQVLWPEHAQSLYMAQQSDTLRQDMSMVRLRGGVILFVLFALVTSFLLRSALARYMAYTGFAWVFTFWTIDMAALLMSTDKIIVMSEARFHIIRPLALCALGHIALSLHSTARFERHRIPAGTHLYEIQRS